MNSNQTGKLGEGLRERLCLRMMSNHSQIPGLDGGIREWSRMKSDVGHDIGPGAVPPKNPVLLAFSRSMRVSMPRTSFRAVVHAAASRMDRSSSNNGSQTREQESKWKSQSRFSLR